MLERFSNLKNVTRKLDPMYQEQIQRAGPVMAVLEIDSYFHPVQSPPAPSPVGSHLSGLRFKVWKDISRHLRRLRSHGSKVMGSVVYDMWSKKIIELCADENNLLAYTLPLFVEGQMQAVSPSPHPAQDVLFNLLSPVIESDGSLQFDTSPYEISDAAPNALISVVLHAGKVPFVLTCHDKKTLSRWRDYLEAGTVLLIPQVLIRIELELPDYAVEIMRSALKEMFTSWKTRRPRIGEVRDWSWMPRLL